MYPKHGKLITNNVNTLNVAVSFSHTVFTKLSHLYVYNISVLTHCSVRSNHIYCKLSCDQDGIDFYGFSHV